MKLKIINKFLIILTVLALLSSCSDKINFETKINEILDWESCNGEFKEEQFDKVFQLIEENPSSLDYDLSGIAYMKVITSDDGNVRAYVLEKSGFGGNPSNGFSTATLMQYKVDGSVNTFRLEEDYSIIDKIHKLDDYNYLVLDSWGIIAQGCHNDSRARVFRINSLGINQVKDVFEFDYELNDEIIVYWEEGASEEDSIYNALSESYDVENFNDLIIHFCKGEINVANTQLSSDTYQIIDGTYNRYKWDGECFKDDTLMSPLEMKNSDYYIRIEQEQDGSCTYRCWNGGEKIGKPALIIRNGKRIVWDEVDYYDYNKCIEFDDSTPLLGEEYRFENNGYEYRYSSGWRKGRTYEDLYVYSPNGDIIYSKKFNKVEP